MAISVTEKQCAKCGAVKPAEEFGPSKQLKDGLASYCYQCRREASRGHYQRWTPEQRAKHRARVLRCRYGMDPALLVALYERQEGCCAICGESGDRPAVNEKRRSHAGVLCVDHDHETGQVRGLLCTNCNIGLGKFSDDVGTLAKAARLPR